MNKRTQLRRGGTQLGPVMALQELLTEYPELPLLFWHLDRTGRLSGDVHDNLDGLDVREVLAAYVAVLGGEPSAPVLYRNLGGSRVGQRLTVVWRDVQIHLSTHADISAYPELNSALAVAA